MLSMSKDNELATYISHRSDHVHNTPCSGQAEEYISKNNTYAFFSLVAQKTPNSVLNTL
jgi:hypothetical protein